MFLKHNSRRFFKFFSRIFFLQLNYAVKQYMLNLSLFDWIKVRQSARNSSIFILTKSWDRTFFFLYFFFSCPVRFAGASNVYRTAQNLTHCSSLKLTTHATPIPTFCWGCLRGLYFGSVKSPMEGRVKMVKLQQISI